MCFDQNKNNFLQTQQHAIFRLLFLSKLGSTRLFSQPNILTTLTLFIALIANLLVHHFSGGTLIAVQHTFSSSLVTLNGFHDIEYTCVEIQYSPDFKLYVYVAYIPPASTSDIYIKHLNAIKSIPLEHSDSIFVLGDFNIPSVDWILPDENSCDHLNVMLPMNITPLFAAEFLNQCC